MKRQPRAHFMVFDPVSGHSARVNLGKAAPDAWEFVPLFVSRDEAEAWRNVNAPEWAVRPVRVEPMTEAHR